MYNEAIENHIQRTLQVSVRDFCNASFIYRKKCVHRTPSSEPTVE